ncbi:DNA polymerase III subunit alpha [Candidatus Tisiphia endosymbiont of Ptychoptera albimana]|uniref:DNA polymerase III subunit alpha n=1 Tax=Candidatus Tisiphia endosymbiont of Ptychoptera albimana TaxID=3066260 RepID=UPI001E052C9D|nr:DNA polymerase III subunit alpha [Rickettsia endosymbiont of Sericostoma sp. HW-2014]
MQFDFIHLRVQSSYSFLESALTIDRIVELAKLHKIPAICLADRGNLFGSLEFALASCKAGIQPINSAIVNIAFTENSFCEIMLIAKDEIGYKNLLKAVSDSFTKNDRKICNHITFDDLVKYQEGLIILSGYTDGIIGKSLIAKDEELAIFWATKLQSIFADRFYFEIMRHNLAVEQSIEESYIKIACNLGIPLVATNKVLFSDVNMHDAHDVLLCISTGVSKEVEDRKKVSNECYFKSPKEMLELFSDLPNAVQNTVHLAQRCYFMAHANPPMLPNFSSLNINEVDIIKKESTAGLLLRLATKFKRENIAIDEQEDVKQQYLTRLNYELDIICRMDFSGYFLIVSDFIKWSKQQGIMVGPGRGSGVGSVVAWSLLITDLDPLKFGLLFERFLNPERISMPDFDIDFCQERRGEVINYVCSKYGDNKVGQIITFGKMQAKAVIKDVSRVLGLPYKYAEYLTDLVPFNAVSPVTLNQAIKEIKELSIAARGEGLYNLDGQEELIKQVLDTSLVLEGLNRHASTHAAGIVIAGKDLVEILPVYKDLNSEMLVVQYSMKYAEIAGLIKFDFLGLQTLTVITKCLELLKEQNINIDFTNMLFDDQKTYEMLCSGRTIGVFQFESNGMQDSLRRLKPDSIQDIIALGALYRPGPMENIPTYIACKHGLQQPDYLHEMLKPILEETYGVIIYQEQVLEIAKEMAGYSLGGADILRKAMGKKIKSEMAEQEESFVKGAIAKGISRQQAQSIFATVAKFASYGFNKAHASAYGVISYQTAYLKANFPAEFLVVCLNLELNNHDKINLFIQEAKNNNIAIIPPNINLSSGYFSTIATSQEAEEYVEPKSITDLLHKSKIVEGFLEETKPSTTAYIDVREERRRVSTTKSPTRLAYAGGLIYALAAIKSVTVDFARILVEERVKNGKFKNIIDVIERLPLKSINRKLLENLIKAGCFDTLHSNRNQLLLSISKLLAYASSYHAEKTSDQFSLIKVSSINQQILIDAEPLDNNTASCYEFEVLGLFITLHPLSKHQDLLSRLNISTSINLQNDFLDGSSQIRIAGVIQKKDSRMSSRGRFITLQLSDQFGIFELTIYSEEILKNFVHLLDVQSLVVVSCDLFKDAGGIRLIAKSFATIDDIINEERLEIKLYPQNHSELCQIVDLLKKRINPERNNIRIILLLKVSIDNNFTAKICLPEILSLETEDFEFLNQFTSCSAKLGT